MSERRLVLVEEEEFNCLREALARFLMFHDELRDYPCGCDLCEFARSTIVYAARPGFVILPDEPPATADQQPRSAPPHRLPPLKKHLSLSTGERKRTRLPSPASSYHTARSLKLLELLRLHQNLAVPPAAEAVRRKTPCTSCRSIVYQCLCAVRCIHLQAH
jgi:hypothetical protein